MEKKIHFCWFGGNKKSKETEKCIATWKKFLPDYEIIEWNENNFDINTCTFVKEAYENKKWAMVSDYVRIYALYNEGGIYFDTDMKVTKDLSNILDKSMFLGYEDSGYVGTAVIGVKEKHNKYIKEILDYYNNLEEFNVDIIYNYANPLIITKILKQYDKKIDENGITIFDNNVYIYPRDYFFPLSYNYQERIFTQNTCMVHLFSATWTDKKEQRTINMYRKFGPKFGRKLNEFIDKVSNFKFSIKRFIYKLYNSLKMKYSIHCNINKRVKKIKEELTKHNSNYIVVSHPENNFANNNILGLFDEEAIYIREQYTQKEARLIAKNLLENEKDTIIFNSLQNGWDRLIQEIKNIDKKVIVKVIINYTNSEWKEDDIWNRYQKIIDLYNKKYIDELGIFNEREFEYYKKKGYEIKLLKKQINVSKTIENKNQSNATRIGIYKTINSQNANVYNQLAASNLIENSICDINPISYKNSMFARLNNINITGTKSYLNDSEIKEKMAKNDINLFVTFADDNTLLVLESFEMGIPGIIGNNDVFKGTDFEEYIRVNNPNDIEEIKSKIEITLENKEKIINGYNIWKKSYLSEVDYLKNEFIKK